MDRILRALDKKGVLRFFLAETTDLVEEMRTIHKASPTATAGMGRLLTMSEILSLDLDNPGDSLTLKVDGAGPSGLLIACSDGVGRARISASHPEIDLPTREDGKLDVGRWVGKDGILSVIKGYALKDPFSGMTELVSGEIAEDFASYFFHSEQTPSLVALGVLVDKDLTVKKAGGLFVQALPGYTDKDLDQLEEAMSSLSPVTEMLSEGLSLEEILQKYFSSFAIDILDEIHPKYVCTCSKEKMDRAIASLPVKDRIELAKEGSPVSVHCEFCHKDYVYTKDDLLKGISHDENEKEI